MGLHDVQAFEMVHYYLLNERMAEKAATYADALVEHGASVAETDDIEHVAFFAAAIMNSAHVLGAEPRTEPTQDDLALWQLVGRIPMGYLTAMYSRNAQPGPTTLRLVTRLYHGGFPPDKLWGLAYRPMAWRVDDVLSMKDVPAEFFKDFGPFVKEMNSAEVLALAQSGVPFASFIGPHEEGVSPFEIARLAAELPADFMAAVS